MRDFDTAISQATSNIRTGTGIQRHKALDSFIKKFKTEIKNLKTYCGS
jgi:hypothetical protein